MQQLLTFFWEICLLRAGPQRAPTAPLLLLFVTIVFLAIATISVLIVESDISLLMAVFLATIELTVEAAVIWSLLLFKNLGSRFSATMVSMLGATAVIYVIMIPFTYLLVHTEGELILNFAWVAYWLALGWWLTIAGFILRQAMNISMIQGSALALTLQVLIIVITRPLLA